MSPSPRRDWINEALSRYWGRPAAINKETLQALRRFEKCAEALRAAISELQPSAQCAVLGLSAIRDFAAERSSGIGNPTAAATLLQPLQTLADQLQLLVARSVTACKASPKPSRGRRRQDTLRQLIFELGVLWTAANPYTKGIKAVKGERLGPMLDFVWSELKHARIRVTSKEALGKQLYELRSRISRAARRERLKTTITNVAGRGIVSVRE